MTIQKGAAGVEGRRDLSCRRRIGNAMRIGWIVLSALLSGAAAAQTPPVVEWEKRAELFAFPGELLVLEEVQKQPPSGKLNVMVEGGSTGSMSVPDVLYQMRQGKRVWSLNFKSSSPPCDVDYSEVDAEKKASDERKHQMERRGEVISLQHQYEQEMYYEERRNRVFEQTCGKRSSDSGSRPTDMRQKACVIVAKDCKARKHW
jgi:hypothetical protein